MKLNYYSLFFIFTLVALESCGLLRKKAIAEQYHEKTFTETTQFLNGRDSTLGTFVELTNGKRIIAKSIEFKKTDLLAYFMVDGEKIKAEDVQKMQNEIGYYERNGGILYGRLDNNPLSEFRYYYVAHGSTESYQGSSKIVRYYKTVSSEGTYTYNGKFTNGNIMPILRQSEEAMEKYREYRKQEKQKNLKKIISLSPIIPATFFVLKYDKEKRKQRTDPNLEVKQTDLFIAGGLTLGGLIAATVIEKKHTKREGKITFQDVIDEFNYYEKKKLEKKEKR